MFDIKSCVKELGLERTFDIMKQQNVLFWDSSQNGGKPEILDSEEGVDLSNLKIIDWTCKTSLENLLTLSPDLDEKEEQDKI